MHRTVENKGRLSVDDDFHHAAVTSKHAASQHLDVADCLGICIAEDVFMEELLGCFLNG